MKLIVSESQLNRILLEYYDADKLYDRESVVNRLKKGPKYMKEYIKKLPHINCTDSQGNEKVCTKIPEVVYQFLFGNF
jgi:hypothetical protein